MKSDSMLLEIIGKLIKEPIKIEINGKAIEYKPFKEIQITDSFFRDFICQRCNGGCCAKTQTNLFWTEDEYYDLPIKDKTTAVLVFINGKEKYLWMYKNKNKECDFYQHNEVSTCLIHEFKPLLCWFTPIWIDHIKDKVIIHKRIIKRNWKYGCKMKYNIAPDLKDDIAKFEKLENIANYLEIETCIPEIIAYLKLCLEKHEYTATIIQAR